jgi:hypothetical protein
MDLIVTLDDATSEIYSMILVEEEGTASTVRALREVIAAHGLFCALYTDRGGHYFHIPKGGEKASRTHTTQVGRALAQLGIEHIASYSTQARGRSERGFRSLRTVGNDNTIAWAGRRLQLPESRLRSGWRAARRRRRSLPTGADRGIHSRCCQGIRAGGRGP